MIELLFFFNENYESNININYRLWTDQLKSAQRIRQNHVSTAHKQLLQQKRDHSARMRHDAHKQLLSFVSMNESWEESLRSNSANPIILANSPIKTKKSLNKSTTTKTSRKSPYETPVAPISGSSGSRRRRGSSTPSKRINRSRSIS